MSGDVYGAHAIYVDKELNMTKEDAGHSPAFVTSRRVAGVEGHKKRLEAMGIWCW